MCRIRDAIAAVCEDSTGAVVDMSIPSREKRQDRRRFVADPATRQRHSDTEEALFGFDLDADTAKAINQRPLTIALDARCPCCGRGSLDPAVVRYRMLFDEHYRAFGACPAGAD